MDLEEIKNLAKNKILELMGLTIKVYGKCDKVSDHFSYKELCCSCCGCLKVDTNLIDKMEKIRSILGVPITVNSCYRCPNHNIAVGGARGSAHIYSYGMDWHCSGKVKAFDAIDAITKVFGKTRWGIYQRVNGGVFFHTGTDYHVNNKIWISRLDNRNRNCYTYYTNFDMFITALKNDSKINWGAKYC